ncbi:zf-HC2 domain-containing protein [Geodermatophilus sp. YIM 151500]|uniref:zf-HC2 domain-containing protein n=1 Tax=Geodermatophilus sp. YIM 151500 TaxID=2984531 RepID=UPI0021E3FBBD|nr:zf-HC2 domain-containing protein [Geodermatophilus sp. YIM 151500]MCV2490806.1 zf-HC2 domain-containing protein [Geodermatophilus sp. YIM 151500]
MHCPDIREAVSARLDGEAPGIPAADLDGHLAACPGCAAWAEAAAALTRRARLAPAPAVPDLTARVLGALPRQLPGARAAARSRLVTAGLRLALLAVGVAQAGLAWPALTSGAGSMSAPVHLAHETGAWNAALAVAFLAVAAVPRWAAGSLPFLGAFSVLLAAHTVADLAAGHVHAERALVHLLLLVGVLLVSLVAWRRRRPRERTVRAVARRRVAA